ncbi:aminotransferase class I and II [Arachidicoccus ginsenosidimutans]|uniref:HipA family kinase n=1 Tax=Arachidicoccus sp. BS20 TaxID=1850526 RepID=UPI0007F0BF55|nr:HipA family kinase [Arachidicoccus sp. BS20]ANI89620.1 aminotransferase class I and II [Arachidicoccus sp. BS20]
MEHKIPELRRVNLVRYLQPFREGGSLPALAEADDSFKYVIKFRGAGQGSKALIADFIGGIMAKYLGLNVPELVAANLDESFGRTEPDEEIQDLLKASTGLNLGVHFLEGAVTFDPAVEDIDSLTASKIVWLDAYLTNVDRTAKNTNLLYWRHALWLIDHGASLYFHHQWQNWEKMALSPFTNIKDHVLLPYAKDLEKVNEEFPSLLTDDILKAIINMVPEEWLSESVNDNENIQQLRDVYFSFLKSRRDNASIFYNQTINV